MWSMCEDLREVADPLVAETLVSAWLADGEIDEAAVARASADASPLALAFLCTVAHIGSGTLAGAARRAAGRLLRRSMALPAWTMGVGTAVPVEAWSARPDAREETVVLGFAHPGRDPHSLSVRLDHSLSGIVIDVWIDVAPGAVAARYRDEGVAVEAVSLGEAATRVLHGLDVRDTFPSAIGRLNRARALLEARLASITALRAAAG